MPVNIQAIRGMHDILPDRTKIWKVVEQTIEEILSQYGYQEIRLPLVEKTELFTRTIGEHTDIVAKEMYTFLDRNNEQLTLRPEGTAGCLRACIEHGLLHNQTQKLWYSGPMFRRERPQKGRQRQFHQIGIEAYGFPGPDIDVELICLASRIFQALDISDSNLEINTLGTEKERLKYRKELVEYFNNHVDILDADSKRRIMENPLRILDSKNPEMQALINDAPNINKHLGKYSRQHFEKFCQLLSDLNIEYRINTHLVRGLDYYSNTVFEWTTASLGAQGTICAGGRYDKLIEYFSNKPVPAIGFAMGLERLIELLSGKHQQKWSPHIYFILADDRAVQTGMLLAELIRNELKNIRVITHMGGGSFKSQFKKADKSGAEIALILGEDELKNGTISIKNLRKKEEQRSISQDNLMTTLKKLLTEI